MTKSFTVILTHDSHLGKYYAVVDNNKTEYIDNVPKDQADKVKRGLEQVYLSGFVKGWAAERNEGRCPNPEPLV